MSQSKGKTVSWLRPKLRKASRIPTFMSFDIETWGEKAGYLHGKFCRGSVCWWKGNNFILKVFYKLDDMVDYLLQRNTPKLAYAWNIKFDGKFILANLKARGILGSMVTQTTRVKGQNVTREKPAAELIDSNGRWLKITVNQDDGDKAKLNIVDAMNYYNTSLEKAIETFHIPHEKIPVKFADVYPGSHVLPTLEKHCANDAKATFELMYAWHKWCVDKGFKSGLTTASTAIELLRTNCLEDVVPMTAKGFRAFARCGYYGGACEVYQKLHEGKWYYNDVNSLYPTTYRYKLPFLKPFWAKVRADDIPNLEKLGFIEAVVYVPDTIHKPPLPYRNSEGKLLFPTGTFKGVWFTEELKTAINQGCQVLTVQRAMLFLESKPFLAKYADVTEQWKLEATTKGEKTIVKTLRNSLYGKFGERSERRTIHFEPLPDDASPLGIEVYDTGEDEELPYWVSTTNDVKGHQLVHIAAAITAYARIKMRNEICELEKQGYTILYMDTDSLVTTKPLPPTYYQLGDGYFKIEKQGDGCFIALAPKTYYANGHKAKAKGMPQNTLSEQAFRMALNGDFSKFYVFWRQAEVDINETSVKLIDRMRQLRALDTKRVHLDNQHSKAVKVDYQLEAENVEIHL